MRSSRDVPAFVLGLSTSGLATVRSLGRAGVPVVGLTHLPTQAGVWSRYCAARSCPDPVRAPDALLELLLREARGRDRPVLFASSDDYVSFTAARRAALDEAFRVAMPPAELCELFVDKRRQYELAARLGVPHPSSAYPETAEEVRRIAGELQYPAFIKPYHGHLWRGRTGQQDSKGIKVRSPAELSAGFDQVFASGLRALVQSIVVGPASALVELQAYVSRDGEVLATFTARKLRQFPVEFGTGTLVVSMGREESAELLEVGLRLLRGAGYRGFAGIEFKRDARDGELKLMELNPRQVLQASHPIDCGVDFPLLEYLDATGGPAPARPPAPRPGVVWWDAPRDLKSFASSRRAGELGAAAWIRSWLPARSFATFAWDDPRPFARSYADRLVRAARGALSRRGGDVAAQRPSRAAATAAASDRA